ncbi:hypothetical protein GGX14DRAFT_608444 [Mycena pura]|uniref:Uncharacterized protein n=1 Tax=Mycena pura TaxID=153505 RepID=A0AAD6VTE0_9AGAR|nr:hypothetical protein GGX14DRAFT_608444 [Mycena pura]
MHRPMWLRYRRELQGAEAVARAAPTVPIALIPKPVVLVPERCVACARRRHVEHEAAAALREDARVDQREVRRDQRPGGRRAMESSRARSAAGERVRRCGKRSSGGSGRVEAGGDVAAVAAATKGNQLFEQDIERLNLRLRLTVNSELGYYGPGFGDMRANSPARSCAAPYAGASLAKLLCPSLLPEGSWSEGEWMAQGWKLAWTRLESLRAAVLKEACTAAIRLAAGMKGSHSSVQCLKKISAPALKCRACKAFTGLGSGLRWG